MEREKTAVEWFIEKILTEQGQEEFEYIINQAKQMEKNNYICSNVIMDLMKKICTKCHIEKQLNEFSLDKNTKSGLRSHCKKCISERYILNREKILSDQKKNYNPEKAREYYLKNINRINKRCREYYDQNRDNILLTKKTNYDRQSRKEYYLKNKERLNKIKSKSISSKRNSDPIFRLKHNLSCLIRNGIKRKGYIKSKNTEDIIGCTFKELMEYLSSMFLDGMSFDNHGEWHVDHVIPLATANTEEEVIRLNHYTNLQPLWAKDNLAKGSKYYESKYGKDENSNN